MTSKRQSVEESSELRTVPDGDTGNGGEPDHRLRLHSLELEDYDVVREIMAAVYGQAGGAWNRDQYRSMLSRFPEGQFCIEDRGKVIAAALALTVDYPRFGDFHTHDHEGVSQACCFWQPTIIFLSCYDEIHLSIFCCMLYTRNIGTMETVMVSV